MPLAHLVEQLPPWWALICLSLPPNVMSMWWIARRHLKNFAKAQPGSTQTGFIGDQRDVIFYSASRLPMTKSPRLKIGKWSITGLRKKFGPRSMGAFQLVRH